MTTFDSSFADQAEHIHHTILDDLTPAESAARAFIVGEVGEDHGPGMSLQARRLVEAIRPHLFREAADYLEFKDLSADSIEYESLLRNRAYELESGDE